MCGIAGHLSPSAHQAARLDAVRSMAGALSHRGPDAEGFRTDGPVALGHRRLSIIDLRPEANQPMANEDGSVLGVVNGEIYNFAELRRELEQKGHRFRSNSDSEVVIHLYEELGEDCVTRLRGMFAFAIWDRRQRRLMLARDRVGKKPLCYAARPDGFWFASELAALAGALPERPELDLAAIDQYLTLQYVPAPMTAYAGVYKLPPAHLLTVRPGEEPKLKRYWRLSFAPGRPVSHGEAVEEIRALLDEAVRIRCVSDVPLGAFLSGGIDSSTVVALLARHSSGPVKTFSIDLPTGDRGEAVFARMVAKRYQTDHHELTVTPDMVSIFPEIVRRYGEPFADASAVPTHYVSELTKRHVTVVLSGDGSDEAFGGYHRYGLEHWAAKLAALPFGLPGAISALFGSLPGPALTDARDFAPFLRQPVAERYLYFLARWHRDKLGLVGPALRERAGLNTVARDFRGMLERSDAPGPLGRLLDLDVQTYLPDDILVKVDIASMAHALEVRAPFLDHVLLERVAQLPDHWKLRGLRGKRILREAVRDLLPAPILRRRKKGFSLPLNRWFREDLATMAWDLLTDRTARTRGLFDPQKVVRILEEHRAGVNHADRLWSLLVLEQWCRIYLDGTKSMPQDLSA
jgi:asparagine synthase (glutamine-hydrolysing)